MSSVSNCRPLPEPLPFPKPPTAHPGSPALAATWPALAQILWQVLVPSNDQSWEGAHPIWGLGWEDISVNKEAFAGLLSGAFPVLSISVILESKITLSMSSGRFSVFSSSSFLYWYFLLQTCCFCSVSKTFMLFLYPSDPNYRTTSFTFLWPVWRVYMLLMRMRSHMFPTNMGLAYSRCLLTVT